MATTIPQPIGNKIDLYRESAGISYRSLAHETGIPLSTLRRKIKNGDDFTIAEIRALSAHLNVSTASWLAAS